MKFSTSYIIKSLLLAGIIVGVVIGLTSSSILHLSFVVSFLPLVFFLFLSNIIHAYLLKKDEGRPQAFVNGFLATLSLKMFVHLTIIFIGAFTIKSFAIEFVITYSIYYLLFTILEVGEMMRIIQKNK
jgi:hypothetical protein